MIRGLGCRLSGFGFGLGSQGGCPSKHTAELHGSWLVRLSSHTGLENFGYCPHPVTFCTIGVISTAIYPCIINSIRLLQSGGSIRLKPKAETKSHKQPGIPKRA